MSDSETQSPNPIPEREPHSLNYYKRVLMQGNGTQWRALMRDIKESYDIAYQAAQACGQLKPEYRTTQVLWKSAIETAQPGIKIRIGKEIEEHLKMRSLKQTKYSE